MTNNWRAIDFSVKHMMIAKVKGNFHAYEAQINADLADFSLTGDLSLHGVTRPETFAVTFEGAGKDPWGNEKAGFSALGSIKRSDYGLTYNAMLETGGVLIGDEVKISLEIEALKHS